MEIYLQSIPPCFRHKKQILYICSCSSCNIPNPMICGDSECLKVHGHPMHQIISVSKLQELLEKNTASMKLLIDKTQTYYREVRESICHQIQKISDMMSKALAYKHTHPVITLFKQQRYNEISPQKMMHLLSYLRGSKTQRKSMQSIKNEVYEILQKIQNQKKNLYECVQYRKLMLVQLIDYKSTFQLKMDNVNTSTLDHEQEFKSILKMLKSKNRKTTQWNLLFRASEHEFSSDSYLLNVEGRGPFLMLFKTNKNRKFGCMANCRADKKEGWLTDGAGFSFIFSIDNEAMFPIKQQAKYRVKAMYIGDKGPQIGSGCDIYISDKCNQNRQSGSNLGGSFELPSNLLYGSKQVKELLAGEENFTIAQYEVYEVN